MRTPLVIFGIALLTGATCFGADDKQAVPKLAEKTTAQPAEQVGAKTNTKPIEETPAGQPLTEQQSADEQAILQADESFVKAYEQADAKSIAALFTVDAEYVDELGNVFQGREVIEESMAEFFANNPGCKLEMNIDTIRFISPGVAVEDGSTTVTLSDGGEPVISRYTTVHLKTDGKWLAASIRDHAPKERKQHREQLKQLDWLIGDWIDEGDDAVITFSCKPVDNGNFLLRTFTIQIAGQPVMSGTQRIGWDPQTGKLRAWIFDSEGGYAEGLWHSDGENWVVKLTGVTGDGQTASCTSIYTFVNEHTMTWQSVDHEIAGVQQPDSEVMTIVHQAPSPLPVVVGSHKVTD